MKKSFAGKKPVLWKRADIAVAGAWLVLALGLFFSSFVVTRNAVNASKLEITVGKEVFGTYSLDEDRTIEIGSGNTCEIKNGEVKMIYADCPDKTCMHGKAISKAGESIVCLPNHVILKITGEDDKDKDRGLDAVSE